MILNAVAGAAAGRRRPNRGVQSGQSRRHFVQVDPSSVSVPRERKSAVDDVRRGQKTQRNGARGLVGHRAAVLTAESAVVHRVVQVDDHRVAQFRVVFVPVLVFGHAAQNPKTETDQSEHEAQHDEDGPDYAELRISLLLSDIKHRLIAHTA